jgi:uncharacterized iron-regulated protein
MKNESVGIAKELGNINRRVFDLGINREIRGISMFQKLFLTVFALFLAVGSAQGAPIQEIPANLILKNGETPVSLTEALLQVRPGQVVVLGEEHGTMEQAEQQLQILKTLREQGHAVSLGMEFFAYPNQSEVDAWRAGALSEADFLKAVQWGQGFPFDAYRAQVQFPNPGSEFLIALNAPRSLTGQIAKVGIGNLTEAERELLPPDWTLGNAAYRRRFDNLMSGSGHVPTAEVLDRYFAAQSTWDETMAWKAHEFLKLHPEQVLVIVVGEFHVQYGGGLPDRLKAHGLTAHTFSLINLFGATGEEQQAAVAPSSQDGVRADFIWTSRFETRIGR